MKGNIGLPSRRQKPSNTKKQKTYKCTRSPTTYLLQYMKLYDLCFYFLLFKSSCFVPYEYLDNTHAPYHTSIWTIRMLRTIRVFGQYACSVLYEYLDNTRMDRVSEMKMCHK